jgi:GT2 family glycosyltransferase
MVKPSFYDYNYFMKGTKSGYGGEFNPYDEISFLPLMKEIAKRFVQSYKPRNALDVGCARGYLVHGFLELGVDAVGIDISKWAIENCDPEVKGRVFRGSATDLSRWKTHEFQLVTAMDILEHLENEAQTLRAIKEICRVADKYIFVRVPVIDNGQDKSHNTIKPIEWWVRQFELHDFQMVFVTRLVQIDGNVEYEIVFDRKLSFVVCIPCYNSGSTLPILLKYVRLMNPDLVVFIENNSTDDTLKIINEWDYPKKLIRLWFRKDAAKYFDTPYDNIAWVRQLALQYVRKLDPDYLLFLDSCCIPLDNLLFMKMAEKRFDITGGVYYRHFPEGLFIATIFEDPTRGLGGPYVKSKKPPAIVSPVAGTSGGCLLLSRKVIQDKALNFYPVKFPLNPDVSEDFGYCLNARILGYNVVLDATVELIHIELNRPRPWTETTDGIIKEFTFDG